MNKPFPPIPPMPSGYSSPSVGLPNLGGFNMGQRQPTQVAESPEALKASLLRMIESYQSPTSSPALQQQKAVIINAASKRLYELTGEVLSQGQFVKVR